MVYNKGNRKHFNLNNFLMNIKIKYTFSIKNIIYIKII